MGKFLKMFGVMALFAVVMMAGGCGGGDDAPVVTNPSQTTPPVAATVNPNGTATTGSTQTVVNTAPGTQGYLATISATFPPSTVITAKNADGTTKALTAPPALTFTVPADSTPTSSGINGVPPPPGFNLVTTEGAVDVKLAGAASATFNPPINVTMAVPGSAVGDVITVHSVKDGTTAYVLLGNFTVTTAGFITFPVSDLCWQIGHKPTVVSVSPVGGATGVPVASNITATFSEPMDPATITDQAFNLTPNVPGTVTYDVPSKTATFNPTANLANGTTYTAHITAVAKNTAGNPTRPSNWTFTTAVTGSTGG